MGNYNGNKQTIKLNDKEYLWSIWDALYYNFINTLQNYKNQIISTARMHIIGIKNQTLKKKEIIKLC